MHRTREDVVLVPDELPVLLARSHVPQPHRLVVATSDRKVLVLACAEHRGASRSPNGLEIKKETTHDLV